MGVGEMGVDKMGVGEMAPIRYILSNIGNFKSL